VDTVSNFLKSHGISVISCYAVEKRPDNGEHAVNDSSSNDEHATPIFVSMRIIMCVSV